VVITYFDLGGKSEVGNVDVEALGQGWLGGVEVTALGEEAF
jgi:hypothetical protein